MVCKSGIYKIKFKIDKIDNGIFGYGNIVGITSDKFDDGSINFGTPGKYRWLKKSPNWIGWRSQVRDDDVRLPHGLYCGSGESGRRKNIFRRSEFKYTSRNGKHSETLPIYRSGDIVVMIYDSDVGQLSFQLFSKKEDNGNGNENEEVSILDSYIHNLPRDLTFYWFVGHEGFPMSITILD